MAENGTSSGTALMSRAARKIKDKCVLALIPRYLQAGIMEGGLVSLPTMGTLQGGPLSPLLSNILLDDLGSVLYQGARLDEKRAR